MRHIILFFCFTLLPLVLCAQIEQAKITYDRTVALNIPEDMDPGMRAMLADLPSQMSSQGELTFHAEAAHYQELQAEPQEAEASSGNATVRIRLGSNAAPEIYYTDLAKQQIVQQRNIFDRQFLIEDAVENFDWELQPDQDTDEQTGLPIRMAVSAPAEGDTLTAWYTPALPVPVGPEGFGGLPGAIIRLEAGEVTYQAKHIELLAEKPEILPPTEGKKTNREKFDATQEKKFEQMTNGSTRVIRIGG